MTVTVGELIRPARVAMVISGIITALGAALGVVPFAALTQLAAIWLGESDQRGWAAEPWVWGTIAVISLFLSQLLYLAGLGITHLAEAKLRHQLRKDLVKAISNLPLGKVSKIPHGAIRKIVCDDTSAIHTLIAHIPGDATTAIVGVLVGGAYLIWTDWKLALALLAFWGFAVLIISRATMRGMGNITERFGEAQTKLSSATIEMLEGIKEIKNFQATDASRTRFNNARTNFSALSYEWVRKSGRAISLLWSLLRPSTVFAFVALLAVLFVSQGWSQLSATLPFFLLAPGLPEGLNTLIGLLQHTHESRMSAQATAELLSEEPMAQGSLAQGDDATPGRVEVVDVSFSYAAGNPVLKGVSFTAEPGTLTALVGPSGGGKSTLARLVARFYDPDQGVIRISGVNVREATFSWLLSRVAIVLPTTQYSTTSLWADQEPLPNR